MNREIKFRAWDKRMSRMLFGVTPMSGSIWWNDGACFDSCGKEYDVMQFTGLLDKNAKEIYEGDVVKIHYPQCPTVGAVFFDCAKGEYLMKDDDLTYHMATANLREVLGNIYDTPEFLP